MKFLVVEDDLKIANALSQGLSQEQFHVELAHTGEDGFFRANEGIFDGIILDLGLPGRSGLEVLKALRKQGNKTPILILTARDGIDDRVSGLDCGADDYLVKPFAFAELLARLRALMRRGRPEQLLRLKELDLEMDLLTRRVQRSGQTIDLTGKEYELLEYLMRNHGNVVSREMLSQDVWREAGRATSLDNVIDVHIARLRRKIDEAFSPKLLHTVRGVGFVLESKAESDK